MDKLFVSNLEDTEVLFVKKDTESLRTINACEQIFPSAEAGADRASGAVSNAVKTE